MSRFSLPRGLSASLVLVLATVAPALAVDAPRRLSGTGYGIGDTAFDFTATDQSGNAVSLYQFYGKFVILDFTAEWCVPSQVEAREGLLTQDAATVAGQGVHVQLIQVLLFDSGSNPATQVTAQRWAKKFNSDYPILTIPSDEWPIVFDQLNNYGGASPDGAGFPTHVILGPDLKIIGVSLGTTDDPTIADLILAGFRATPAYQVFNLINLVDDYALVPRTTRALERPLEGSLTALLEQSDDESTSERVEDACESLAKFRDKLRNPSLTLTGAQIVQLAQQEMEIGTALGCHDDR